MFVKWLTCTLVGVTTFLVEYTPTYAQSLEAVEAIANSTTVRIYTGSSPGSGVIIAKADNRYTVLTAKHVIEALERGESGDLTAPDGQSYDISSRKLRVLQNSDLALVEFESNKNYPTVTLSTYPYRLAENRDYGNPEERSLRFSNPEEGKHFIFVAGWPNDDENEKLIVNPGLLVDTEASVVSNPGTRYQSYGLVYSNLTYVGMSGGAVLDSQGRLIGIHGRADGRVISKNGIIERAFLEEEQEQSRELRQLKVGYSLGISTETFLRLAKEQNISVPVHIESSSPPLLSSINLRQSWQPSIAAAENTPFYWVTRGNQLWRIGLIQDAQENFDKALSLKSDFYLAAFAKGFVYGFSHDYMNALTYCNRAVTLSEQIANSNPDADRYYDAWRCKAGALQYLGQFPAALEALNQAIQIQDNRITEERNLDTPLEQRQGFHSPNDFDTQGELLYALQQYNGALSAFERSMDLRESYHLAPSPLTLNSHALTLMSLNRPEDALKDLQQAIKLDPGYATAWAHQGEALAIMNQFNDALNSYNYAVKIDAFDPYLWTNRGFLLYQMGQCQAALDSMEQALKHDPTYEIAIENQNVLQEECHP